MARVPRVVLPGIPHHVTQRGNGRQQTFLPVVPGTAYLIADAPLRRSLPRTQSTLRQAQGNRKTYSWNAHVNLTRAYAVNGLNQYVSAGGAAFCYDANGNLTADGGSVYLYDVENRLVEKRVQGAGNSNCAALSYGGALQAELRYDPTGRLYQVTGGTLGIQRFVYDANAMVAEYNAAGTMLRRYVHGSNVEADDPLIVYEGAAVSDSARRYLHADPRGSIVAVTNWQGTALATNSYDAFGIPDSASGTDIASKGRFRYTGQAWLPELGMYYYKARIYSPTLGRFLQTDPIGYDDQYNLYAYVANDPINGTDFSGMCRNGKGSDCHGPPRPGENSFRRSNGNRSNGSAEQGADRQVAGAANDFRQGYQDMRDANTIGADKYFHCRANCEAATRGEIGESVAETISDARESFDQGVKGDPASASAEDQAANRQGREAGSAAREGRTAPISRPEADRICRAACGNLAPKALDEEDR